MIASCRTITGTDGTAMHICLIQEGIVGLIEPINSRLTIPHYFMDQPSAGLHSSDNYNILFSVVCTDVHAHSDMHCACHRLC